MMSGLRSQRDKMMTCVSLKSGMASSGRCIIDHAPHVQAAATRANTRNLFLTENSMIRLIIYASVRVHVARIEGLAERDMHGRGVLIRIVHSRGRSLCRGAHAAFRIDQEIS